MGVEQKMIGDQGLLSLIDPTLRGQVEARMRSIRAPKGRTIFSVGGHATDVLFVVEGEVQVLLYSNNGREVSVRDLGPGSILGELAALDGKPRSASVVAASDVRLRMMTREDFLTCVESSPVAALWLTRRLAHEVRRLTERVFELSALNVQARLHCELLRMARGDGAVAARIPRAPTHAELANRIGTHREAVTREMRSLAQMNIIRNHRRSLEFLDIPELERAVFRAVGQSVEAHPA